MASNYISKVAIVGAGGNLGTFITTSLLATGKHTITALTRHDSTTTLPSSIHVKKVDYNNTQTLIDALKGQEALIITLSGQTPQDTQAKLIHAAAEAGVKWIFPNEWSPDTGDEGLVKDVFIFQSKVETRKAIQDLGKSSYIALSTGFWYEWSLAIAPAFGIDFAKKTATFFDQGETKISVSTWPQIGRTVAAILSLPITSSSDGEPCLENLKNKLVYTSSFTISQIEMLDSAIRVTGTHKSDWTITKEPAKQRYADGLTGIKEGKRIGFAKMMYTRVFYDDGCGDFESRKGTLNSLLDLPEEDLDEATERALERSKASNWVSNSD